MLKYVLITDKINAGDAIPEHPEQIVVTPTDFIANKVEGIDFRRESRLKVVNLCSHYDYQSKGYYCSLLADARGQRCVPSVPNIIQLNWKRNYQAALPELDALLDKTYKEPADEPLTRTYFVYFGRTENEKLEAVARRVFDLFRFPLIALQIHYARKWQVKSIESVSLADIPDEKIPFFTESLQHFTGAAWSRGPSSKKEKFWMAILFDEAEKYPPSDKETIKKFIRAAKDTGIAAEVITKHDFASLLEFDSLFIRETTAINHHTYRMAHKAESEGIPVIDDPQSIIRCCNKVYLYELLESKRLPIPRTAIIDRRTDRQFAEQIAYPVVLKIPDESFSRGMVKADRPETFLKGARELLKSSEIILVQEFVKSDYDWRIGVLNGEAIFACKYYMAKNHWQIYNHSVGKKEVPWGDHQCYAIGDTPADVIKTAVKAASLIGTGFYGVDVKATDDGIYVMEVNDNCSIDTEVEDGILGDRLYKMLMDHFRMLMER